MVEYNASALNRVFHALADPTRRAMLRQLADGEHSVGELAEPFDMSFAAAAKHVKVLEEAGLIRRARVAKTRPVHLEPEGLKRAGDWIDHYRQYWEGAFDRMDALIARLQAEEDRNGRQ